ncbi:Protein of unknown function [Gryllus bimaculatus]|nr:Protein of unknown function [Gryllus bimaculatus]
MATIYYKNIPEITYYYALSFFLKKEFSLVQLHNIFSRSKSPSDKDLPIQPPKTPTHMPHGI